jgi:hypothetical protein
VYEVSLDDGEFYQELRDPARLLVSPKGMTWLVRCVRRTT